LSRKGLAPAEEKRLTPARAIGVYMSEIYILIIAPTIDNCQIAVLRPFKGFTYIQIPNLAKSGLKGP
jgi:hypothetical protein